MSLKRRDDSEVSTGDNSEVSTEDDRSTGDNFEGSTGDNFEGSTGDNFEGSTGDNSEVSTGDNPEVSTGENSEGSTENNPEGSSGENREEAADKIGGDTGDRMREYFRRNSYVNVALRLWSYEPASDLLRFGRSLVWVSEKYSELEPKLTNELNELKDEGSYRVPLGACSKAKISTEESKVDSIFHGYLVDVTDAVVRFREKQDTIYDEVMQGLKAAPSQ
ncbi:hypothetical protein BASA60_009862 [Batrachochytrium salamandrivorans]|nr:hypothetical protein BASA60_009862 [Batrachochytrium salamandrivorans]